MLGAERLQPRVRFREVEDISPGAALAIGGAQCLALIPGMSRSAATIIGGLVVGVERRTAAEFSFFAALPVLFGATAIQIVKNADELALRDGLVLGLGTLTAFVFATVAIKVMLAVVARVGFCPFAVYRILLGSLLLLFVL